MLLSVATSLLVVLSGTCLCQTVFASSTQLPSSTSTLDAQIDELKKAGEVGWKPADREYDEDGFPATTTEISRNATAAADSDSTVAAAVSELTKVAANGTASANEAVTKRSAPAQEGAEVLPDPSHVADPSLLPVHLQKPDYRPLSGGGAGAAAGPRAQETGDEAPASSTVATMGEGEAAPATTPAPNEPTTTEQPTTTAEAGPTTEATAAAAAAAAETAREEAEAAAQEAEAKEQEADAAQAEAEQKQQEAEAKQQEAAVAVEEAAAAPGGAPNSATTTPEEASQSAEEAGSRVAGALAEALRAGKLLVQNITLVLPSDSPSLEALLGALLANRNVGIETAPAPTAPPVAQMLRPLVPLPYLVRPSQPLPSPLFEPIPPNVPPSYLVGVEQLHGWIKAGRGVKVLDASYEPEPRTGEDHIRFYTDFYAQWDKLIREKKGRQYALSHIPGAVPFNLNIATYPSWNERQALYPADKFEQYVQRLGVDRDHQLVIYARGPLGGMLHAARAWFLFRIYGHENVSVLDGGLDAWRRADLPANDAAVATSSGNWRAKLRPELLVNFEELTSSGADGYCILGRLYWYNFLDARPRNEFFGLAHPMSPQRSRVPGTKPFPADELVAEGLLLAPGEIARRLQQVGYARNYPTIVMGNTADEASLVLLALAQLQDTGARLYNGGVEEVRKRAPYLLSNRQ